MALRLEAIPVYGSFRAVPDCRVDLVGYMWPVNRARHSAIHATLAWVSHQVSIMCPAGEVWLKLVLTRVCTAPSNKAVLVKIP